MWKYFSAFSVVQGTIISYLFFIPWITLAAVAPGPDAANYYTTQTTYDWVDSSTTGTSASLSDEDCNGLFPVGFSFQFYNNDYTEFYIQSDGLINFSEEGNDIIDCPSPYLIYLPNLSASTR